MVSIHKPASAAALLAIIATLTTSALGNPTQQTLKAVPDIRADTNRDGVVDITGDSDVRDKNVWTATRGAIFLPNIGDSLGRCKGVDTLGNDLTDLEVAACNDASGDAAISPEYFAPMRTMPLKDIGDDAYATVAAGPDEHTPYVRVFWQASEGGKWTYIDPEFRFNATMLRSGLRLGIDSRRVVSDADKWDGSIKVRFTVHDGEASASDEVALKLAPVLFHHHLQAVDTLIAQNADTATGSQKRFVSQLDAARAKTSITKPLLTLSDNDVWVQDIMEPGYSSMPGPNGKPISVRVIVRTAQSTRTAGRQVLTKMRSRGVGAYQPSGKGYFGFREINSGGNIETIPPYASKSTGVKYPVGRIITGKHHDLLPAETMLKFYESQKLQHPLILETGWLFIGHVDEFVSFLPANNSLGFTISIADPMSAFEVLKKAEAEGHGATPAYSVGPDTDPIPSFGGSANATITISDVLRSPRTNEHVQKYASRYIEQNLAVLLQETGLTEKDVIRVPTLFEDVGEGFAFAFVEPNLPPHFTTPPPGETRLGSFYPAAINGIVIGQSYICAQAFGPVVKGVDILQDAVAQVYKKAGMDAHFIDNFYSHHTGGGEVHCGTNTLRETAVKWW
jgi:protein-arginine deiminase